MNKDRKKFIEVKDLEVLRMVIEKQVIKNAY